MALITAMTVRAANGQGSARRLTAWNIAGADLQVEVPQYEDESISPVELATALLHLAAQIKDRLEALT